MYLKQAEILRGLDERFIAKMMEVSVESSYEAGTVLFNQGDPALNFFVLVKGRIKLSIGDYKNSIYTVDHSGEAFGWSSLVGSHTYTASAKCVSPSTLTVFNRDHMEMILSGDPESAVMFYKNLALTLGIRLNLINSQFADHLSINDKITYGTGQILEQAEQI
jgi:CRP/FNR family transcriptional regulator, cyclic AMP receptor protein